MVEALLADFFPFFFPGHLLQAIFSWGRLSETVDWRRKTPRGAREDHTFRKPLPRFLPLLCQHSCSDAFIQEISSISQHARKHDGPIDGYSTEKEG